MARPSPPKALKGQGKQEGRMEQALADLKRKRDKFESLSGRMSQGWSPTETVDADTVAKRARMDSIVEVAASSLEAKVCITRQATDARR